MLPLKLNFRKTLLVSWSIGTPIIYILESLKPWVLLVNMPQAVSFLREPRAVTLTSHLELPTSPRLSASCSPARLASKTRVLPHRQKKLTGTLCPLKLVYGVRYGRRMIYPSFAALYSYPSAALVTWYWPKIAQGASVRFRQLFAVC